MDRRVFSSSVAGLALLAAACASPPQAELDAANTAIERAAGAQASEYAPVAFKTAEDAKAQLDAEVDAQAGKFALTRSYSEATKLAAAAQTAAETALREAESGRARAKTEAETLMTEARTALDDAKALLAKAPRGKGTQADIQAMQADLDGAETVLGEAASAMTAQRYLDARAKADIVKSTATTVKSAVEQAMAARRGRRG